MNKSFLDSDEIEEPPRRTSGEVISLLSLDEPELSKRQEEPFIHTNTDSMSMAETVRKSGLAYSAGIACFASVVFMLVFGGGADLLFGSSPWGIVVGIVLGSVIGFVQFFRINSRIFAPETKSAETTSLFDEKSRKK